MLKSCCFLETMDMTLLHFVIACKSPAVFTHAFHVLAIPRC